MSRFDQMMANLPTPARPTFNADAFRSDLDAYIQDTIANANSNNPVGDSGLGDTSARDDLASLDRQDAADNARADAEAGFGDGGLGNDGLGGGLGNDGLGGGLGDGGLGNDGLGGSGSARDDLTALGGGSPALGGGDGFPALGSGDGFPALGGSGSSASGGASAAEDFAELDRQDAADNARADAEAGFGGDSSFPAIGSGGGFPALGSGDGFPALSGSAASDLAALTPGATLPGQVNATTPGATLPGQVNATTPGATLPGQVNADMAPPVVTPPPVVPPVVTPPVVTPPPVVPPVVTPPVTPPVSPPPPPVPPVVPPVVTPPVVPPVVTPPVVPPVVTPPIATPPVVTPTPPTDVTNIPIRLPVTPPPFAPTVMLPKQPTPAMPTSPPPGSVAPAPFTLSSGPNAFEDEVLRREMSWINPPDMRGPSGLIQPAPQGSMRRSGGLDPHTLGSYKKLSGAFGTTTDRMGNVVAGATLPTEDEIRRGQLTSRIAGQNAQLSDVLGTRTDRLGNVVAAPAMPAFFKDGGEVMNSDSINEYLQQQMSGDQDSSAALFDNAQKLLADVTQANQVEPMRRPVKRTSRGSGGESKTDKNMSLKMPSLAASKGMAFAPPSAQEAAETKSMGTAREQMEELARVYQLKINAARNKARGLGADTFGAPTLEGQTLVKKSLSKRSFAKGGFVSVLEKGDMSSPAYRAQLEREQGLEGSYPEMIAAPLVKSAVGAARAGLDRFLASRAPKRFTDLENARRDAAFRTLTERERAKYLGSGQLPDDFAERMKNASAIGENVGKAPFPTAVPSPEKKRANLKEYLGKTVRDPSARRLLVELEAQNEQAQEPEYRAKGSPEEGEVSQAERDAASRPAFVTPKSGIGRKSSTKAGELEAAALQGISETPYNLLGAPVDLLTMAMRPLGYNVEAPMLGSEDLKRRATRAGIRQEPPKEGTAARALFNLAEIGSSAVNPAAPVRAGVKAAKAVGDKAADVAKDFQEYNRQLNVPGASYVSRAPGGYFPTSRSTEGGILSNLDKAFDPILKEIRNIDDPEKRQALTMLFNQKAKDFFTKQAGSVDDPLRKDILSGALKFERSTPMGDTFPQALQKGVAQGDLESLRLLEKAYDEMLGMQSTVPRRVGTDEVEGVMQSQIMANIQANLDKIPDAQLLAYAGRKPGQGPTGVADVAAQIRQKIKDNPTLFSTVLEPRIAETLFVNSRNVSDSDMARYPSLYGSPAVEAMVTPGGRQPDYGEAVDAGYFLPEMQVAIDKGQPIQDIRSDYVRMLGLGPTQMLRQAEQMDPDELNQMGFPDFLKKAYANTQQVDRFEKSIPLVKKAIEAGKVPPADIMTFGVKDFLPAGDDFRWVKVVKPDGVRAIAAGMNNSVAGYAKSTTYGSLKKGRAALDSGEAEVYSLYDNNNVPHVTVEYLTAKPGVPDAKKNTIAQLTGNGPLTANATPENYAPQIVDLLNNLRPNSMPPTIKKLLEDTGQKVFLDEEVLAPLYFGVPIQALR